MELNDYKSMYNKMGISDEMDGRIRNAVLNQQEGKGYGMKKSSIKKTAVAVVLCGIVLVGGISAYAESEDLTLISLFSGGNAVKNKATHLINTEVQQDNGANKKQAEFATFKIAETVCDKNHIVLNVEVKAADNDKYLLVPKECDTDVVAVRELNIWGTGDDFNGDLTVEKYAESLGKKCLKVDVLVDAGEVNVDSGSWLKEDGTMCYNIFFKNVVKQEKMDFVCETAVYPTENEDDAIKDKINFSLTDKTDLQVLKYLPCSNAKIAGTDLVVDEVYFEKSDLSVMCNVKYHYTGKLKNWKERTLDAEIVFYMLDENEDMIPVRSYDCKTQFDGKNAMGSNIYTLEELPDKITFEASDNILESMDREEPCETYDKFEVELVK